MKKSTLLMVLSLVLALALGVGGTMAYLQDTDADVNVMTLGNVHIKQIEKERVEQTNSGTDELQDFTQGKPLYPAVGEIAWVEGDNGRVYQQWPTGGSSALFDTEKLNNELDKFVFVENTGKSDAYFRTIFGFELADEWTVADVKDDKMIHLNTNDAEGDGGGHYKWTWADDVLVLEDGRRFAVATATYVGKADTHKDGILPAGETSRPSLLQVFMDKTATNEDIESLGETYDILVLSQAVQTQGFADAQSALDTAFGTVEEMAAEWLGGLKGPIIVYTTDELRAAMKLSDVEIYLGDDLLVDDDKGTGYCFYAKYNNVINLNGHDITVDLPGKDFYGIFYTLSDAQLDIVGDGELKIIGGVGNFVWCTGSSGDATVNIYGGNWIQDSVDFNENRYCEGIYANREGDVNVYGGTFNWKGFEKFTANVARDGVVTIYGGTFINFDPRVAHDNDGSYVAEGYTVVEETQANGDIWYTVVKK